MKPFLFIVLLILSLMSPATSMAEEGDVSDAGGVAQPKSGGITVVPVRPRNPLKTTVPAKKEKSIPSQVQPDLPVSDETGSVPPGLDKKGELPKGLQKKDKTPGGWEKGKKLGWEKDKSDEVKESIFERKDRERAEKEKAKLEKSGKKGKK